MIKFCPICGAKHIGGRFCFSCGADLNQFLNAQNNEKVEENVNETPIKEERIDGDITSISSGLDSLIEKEESKIKEYEKNVIKARAYSIRERYEEARAIYENFIEEDPSDMNGYMGVIRVVSKNYTEYEGKEIEEAINVAKLISREENLEIFDQDYAKYRLDREQYIINKEKERQLKIEQERLEKIRKEEEARRLKEIEEERIRKEEEERVRKEQEEKLKKEIEYYIDAIERHINEVEIEYLENFKKDLYTSKTINELKDLVKKHMDNIDVIAKEKEEKLEKERQALENEKRQMKSFDYIVNGDGSFSIKKCIDPNIVELANMKNVKYIEKGAFSGLQNLVKVVLPEGVKTIEQDMFANCPKLKEVIIPSSVTTIESRAFNNCASLEEIVIPNSVVDIQPYIFIGCSKLRKITIPFIGSKNEVGNKYAFLGYLFNFEREYITNYIPVSLQEIVLTNTKHINEKTFYNCKNLIKISLPDCLESIGENAFEACLNLKEVHISSLNKWLNIDFGKWYSNPLLFSKNIYINDKLVNELVIPEGVEDIKKYAFINCLNIEKITLPKSIKSIGYDAFDGCKNLKEIHINDLETWLNIDFETLYSNPLYLGPKFYINGKFIDNIEIPDNITKLKKFVFAGLNSLQNINLNKITTIEDLALISCNNLKELVIPNSVTSIGTGILTNCSCLNKLVIPFLGNKDEKDNSTSFLAYLFEGQSCGDYKNVPASLKEVTLTNTKHLNNNSFYGCQNLEKIELPKELESVGGFSFYGCNNLKEVVIPDSVTFIGPTLFYGCNSLTKIQVPFIGEKNEKNNPLSYLGYFFGVNKAYATNSIPGSLEEVTVTNSVYINPKTFYGCANLKVVNLLNNVKFIETNAFYGCSKLEKITLPKSLEHINVNAFSACAPKTVVYLGDLSSWLKICFSNSDSSPVKYGSKVLINNEEIIDLVIPEDIECIGQFAFYYFNSIKTVTIPSTCKSIGTSAFLYANSIEKLTIPFEPNNSVAAFTNMIKEINLTGGEVISEGSFSSFIYLEKFECSSSVKEIKKGAFKGCNYLKELIIPLIGDGINNTHLGYIFGEKTNGNYIPKSLENITITNEEKIGKGAFSNIKNKINIKYLKDIKEIDESAFYNSFIEEFAFGNSLEKIGANAFSNCINLKEINLSEALKEIGENAFSGCKLIEKIKIPSLVEEIKDNTFKNCSSLKEISWNEKVYYIGKYAFSGTSIESLVLSVSIDEIDDFAFENIRTLKEVTLNKNLVSIGEDIFNGSINLEKINYLGDVASWLKVEPFSILTIQTNNILFNNEEIIDLVIPEGTTLINDYAFYGITSIRTITLPKSIEDIGEDAFGGLPNLECVNYLGTIESWCKINFISELSNPNNCAKKFLINNEEIVDLVIPKSVEKINFYAFLNVKSIKTIKIPDTIKIIETCAFMGCSNVTSITLPFIGRSINEPNYLKILFDSNETFNSLKEVIVTKCEDISSYCFRNCQSLEKVKLPSNLKRIGTYAFSGCASLQELVIPENVTEMGSYILRGCNNLRKLTLPFIGTSKNTAKEGRLYNLFSEAPSSLCEINITNTEVINDYIFSEVSKLIKLSLPKNLKKIEKGTFSNKINALVVNNNSDLDISLLKDSDKTKVIYDKNNKPTYISSDSFKIFENNGFIYSYSEKEGYTLEKCILPINSREIELPKTINNKPYDIGVAAFVGFNYLEEIVIPEGVREIDGFAFNGCSKLNKVTLPNSLIRIGYACFRRTIINKVDIPWGVEVIEGSAFEETKITSIYLPLKIRSVGAYAFRNTSLYGLITIPEMVEYIGENAFENTFISEVYFRGASIKKIKIGAFRECKSLEKINLPNSIEELEIPIGEYNIKYSSSCFYNCQKLRSLRMPKKIKKLWGTFEGCLSLVSVDLPEELEELSGPMFHNCHKLNKLIIPKGVNKLHAEIFYDNRELKEITLMNPEIILQPINGQAPIETVYIPKETNLITLAKLVSKMKQAFGKDVKVKQLKD